MCSSDLEFWATWCVPCVEAIPHVNELTTKFQGKPIQFISITDESERIVELFLKKRPIQGWVGLDTNKSVFEGLGVGPIPRVVIVDKAGNFVTRGDPRKLTAAILDDVLTGKHPILSEPEKEQVPTNNVPLEDIWRNGERNAAGISGDEEPLFVVRIAEATDDLEYMSWGSGDYVNTQIDFKSLLNRVYHLRSPWWVVYEAPVPKTKLKIAAKMPFDASGKIRREDLIEPMVGSALEATFGLSIRRELREADVYVLTAPNGPGRDLRPPDSNGGGHHSSITSTDGMAFAASDTNLEWLLTELEKRLDRPVVNETGLEGKFDWGLSYEADNRDSLIRAAREQLGLVLIPKRQPIEMLVVKEAAAAEKQESR